MRRELPSGPGGEIEPRYYLTHGAAGEKTALFQPFVYKMIILPRQARDKHRENSKKGRFLAEIKDAADTGKNKLNTSFVVHFPLLSDHFLWIM
eukprot:COSAG06_NODE_1172_length_10425_cov_7.741042_7_plen_93_part_00